MIYTWYKIFNLAEFNALDLVSKEYELELEDIGIKTVTVTKGKLVSILYEGIFLSVNLNSVNPLEFDGHAVWISGTNDVYLGIAVPDEV